MSIIKTTELLCDGSMSLGFPLEPCEMNSDPVIGAAADARKEACLSGWRKVGKFDFCPECLKHHKAQS
jgi:hypothetical protein